MRFQGQLNKDRWWWEWVATPMTSIILQRWSATMQAWGVVDAIFTWYKLLACVLWIWIYCDSWRISNNSVVAKVMPLWLDQNGSSSLFESTQGFQCGYCVIGTWRPPNVATSVRLEVEDTDWKYKRLSLENLRVQNFQRPYYFMTDWVARFDFKV
jgi:hypothetical protein